MNSKRILLIDDEETFTRTLKLYLERTGRFTVRVENGGLHALAAAKSFQPDLILLDVIMPDIDGGDVAAQLQEDPALRNIPIFFLTAAVSRDEVSTPAGVIGGQVFIPKPVSAKEILDLIDRSDAGGGAQIGSSRLTNV